MPVKSLAKEKQQEQRVGLRPCINRRNMSDFTYHFATDLRLKKIILFWPLNHTRK